MKPIIGVALPINLGSVRGAAPWRGEPGIHNHRRD
jgi:hypothetical protein